MTLRFSAAARPDRCMELRAGVLGRWVRTASGAAALDSVQPPAGRS